MAFSKQGPKLYFGELMGALFLYGAALAFRHYFAVAHPGLSLLKTSVMLLPVLPVFLMALAIWRFYFRMDEWQRRITLENVAVASSFMALVSITLGLATDAGLPRLGIIWAWPLMGMGWLGATAWRGIPMAIAAVGWCSALWIAARMLVVIAVPTLIYALVAPHLGWPHRAGFIILFATAIFLARQAYCLFLKRSTE